MVSAPKKSTKKTTTKKKTRRKKADATPDKVLTAAQAWAEKINKSPKFRGKSQVRMASEMKNPYGLRRPTNFAKMDRDLGGGLHAGGLIEVQGSQSTGKTFFCWNQCAQNQRVYGEESSILIACTELRPDKSQARAASFCVAYSDQEISEMNINRQLAGEPEFTPEEVEDLKKQIGDVVIVMAENAEKLFDVLLDAIESGVFQIVVIDSMGALLPKAKDEGDVTDKSYGGASVPVTDFMNKLYPLLIMDRPDGSMTETTILAINQARANIGGGRFSRNEKGAAGAYAYKHAQLVSILLEKGAAIRESESGPIIGRVVRWLLLKGKAGTHDGLKGQYNYYHLEPMEPVFWKYVQENWIGGIDFYNEWVETAIEQDVIKKSGSWLTWEREDGDIKYQGANKMAQHLADNPEQAEELRELCLRKAGIFVRYK